MVQPDIPLVFAVGAALAYAHNDVSAKKELDAHFWRGLSASTLFMVTVFLPMCVQNFWLYPNWQLMHVVTGSVSVSIVLVSLLLIVAANLLGYLLTYRHLRSGDKKTALFFIWIGFFLNSFLSLFGWDGTGYRRFFTTYPGDLSSAQYSIATWFSSTHGLLVGTHLLVLLSVGFSLTTWALARRLHQPFVSTLLMQGAFVTVFSAAVGALTSLIMMGVLEYSSVLSVLVMIVVLSVSWRQRSRFISFFELAPS